MNNFNNYIFSILTLLSLTATQNVFASPLWQSNNIYLLHGMGYEVGSDEQTTITLEHSSEWSLGDLFIFTDLTKYRDSNQGDGVYGEFSPRLSLSKITSTDFNKGFIKDLLITIRSPSSSHLLHKSAMLDVVLILFICLKITLS